MGQSTKSEKYNILMLAPTMFFADYGCHVRILEEAVVLRKLGHRVTIVTYPNGRDIWEIDVRRSWGVPFNYRIEVGSSRHKIYLDALLTFKALFVALKEKPDIIHGHLHEGGLIGWIVSKLTGAPLVFDFQGSLTGEMLDHKFLSRESRFFKPLLWLERKIDHLGKAVLTSSKHGARLLTTKFGVPEGQVHPTPDCVNPDAFDPHQFSAAAKQAEKERLHLPVDKKILVYVGLLTEYQGVGLLLQALQQLSAHRNDFHLLLMGFPAVAFYQAKAQSLGIGERVTFTGKVAYEQLARYLAAGDIAIAPKLSNTEGNGKILNYASMALPTVAFKTPVSQEYLGSYGIYARERTAPALADAIETALNLSDAERTRRGNALRHRILSHFTWEQVGEQIETIYGAVLNGHPKPAMVAKSASIQR